MTTEARLISAEILLVKVLFAHYAEKALNPTIMYSSLHEEIKQFIEEEQNEKEI